MMLCDEGTFLVGMLTTMVFVDVTKVMVGRLRPVFLEVCEVNVTVCLSTDQQCDADDVCMQSDQGMLRWARYSRSVTVRRPSVCICEDSSLYSTT